MILMHGLPAAIGTLGLAAVFSAELSSADAVLFMLTTSLSQDLYKRFVAPASDERQVLLVARVTTIVAGAIGTALAIVSPTVIGVLSIFYTLLGVSLFVPILGGLYVRRAATAEALAAIAAGVGGMLFVHITTAGKGYGHVTPALIGLAAALVGVRRRARHAPGTAGPGRRSSVAAHSSIPRRTLRMASDIFTLSGKVVAVVGAGSGIGEAIALGAAAQGASFVACLDSTRRAQRGRRRDRSAGRRGRRRTSSTSRTPTR